MPPTIQGEQPRRDHRVHHGDKRERTDLYNCRIKYNNSLPDIPFDPKFIAYPFDMNRSVFSCFFKRYVGVPGV